MVISMVDRTDDFRKAVKNVKKCATVENGENMSKLSNPFGRRKQRSDFSKNAKEILQSITKLQEFMLQHRNAYINGNQVIGLSTDSMTDHERDQIDEEAQTIIKKCNEAIAAMQQNIKEKEQNGQVVLHRQHVLMLIQNYLKSVCKIYSEQRAIRVKLVVDKKRISRLHNPETHKKSLLSIGSDVTSTSEAIPRSKSSIQTKYSYDESDDELSEDEAATLKQENELLLNDMNSMVDEIKAIEGKVIEISRLQEIFSEQALQQEGDIEMVSEKVVESTENIKDGNEALREAIKNNAGFRVWILFFLVMCSFSLLFLEWYS